MIIELTDVAHGGYAVGRADDGRVVFARFGLPGERVDVRITGERSSLLYGDVVDVKGEASPERVEFRWPEAGPLGVGGADLQHVSWPYQQEWKTNVLRSTLNRVGGVDLANHIEAEGIEPKVRAVHGDAKSQGWGRRTRLEFVIDDEGRPAMYGNSSNELRAVTSFPLGTDELEELDLFGAWASWWHPGMRVRAVAPSGSDPVIAVGESTWWAPGMRAERFVREDVVSQGELYSFRVRAAGFWQIHPDAASELTSSVLRGAGHLTGRSVVELYSGAGMLTQPLGAAVGPKGSVKAFEGARGAVEDARANLRDFPWVSVRRADIDERFTRRFDIGQPEVLVADPPRSGLGIKLADEITQWGCEKIVLVSCDPAAMARDVARIHSRGWRVESLDAIDLFAQTYHFECVTTLVRR